jgi:MFS family permease
MLEILRPRLMTMYHLDAQQIAPHYITIFLGMLLGSIIFGLLVNIINYRTCFILIWIIQILGLIKLLSLSPIIVGTPAIHQLKSGMLLLGMANGGIFAVIHPLIALIFHNPHQSQTRIMNYLHTNWPLFIILTCLFEILLVSYHLDWFWAIYAMLFWTCFYFVIALFLPLPIQLQSHRIPISTRLKSIVRPGYLLLLFCMVCSCIIEYSPAIWVKNWVEIELQIRPVYFLIFINSIQFFVRLSAGFVVRKMSPPAMLGASALLIVLSLFTLSFVNQVIAVLFAIGVLAMGFSWHWPTYLAIVADRYPLSSGLGLGLMNAIGYLALVKSVPDFSKLIQVENPHQAFLDLSYFAIFGLILLIGVYIAFRSQGGYKVLSKYDRSL